MTENKNNLINDHSLTNQTNETNCKVTNHDFFNAVFGSYCTDSSPVYVSFDGSPHKAHKSLWAGVRWNGQQLTAIKNNYFSVSSFYPNDANFNRKSKNFAALHALVLDDVGTKISKSLIKLEPSWAIETSEGNFQYGYILDVPLYDINKANKLFKAVIDAGLSDPGMSGPSSRLARLPVGVNAKHDPIFFCSLTIWNPNLKYAVEDFYLGLGLKNVEVKSLDSKVSDEELWIPRPLNNPVIQAMKERKLYKAALKDGKHDVTCPWVLDHTGEVDSGTAYFEPSRDFPLGGFKCLHGHCIDKHVKDLLGYLNVEERFASMKPVIRLHAGEIHRIVDFAERELSSSGEYFQQNGMIVSVITDPSSHETKIRVATSNDLTRALSELVAWEVFDLKGKKYKRTDPPIRALNILADGSSCKHLPVLKGLIRQPYFRDDGTLVKLNGYDNISMMYGDFSSNSYTIPDYPSQVDAINALNELKGLLTEFSFKVEADMTATLSAILTASVRPVLRNAPMFHVRAHMIGSGKSYLCRLISIFASKQANTPISFPSKDDECNKVLLAEMLTSSPVIEFDNLTSDLLPHKSLCTAITSEFIKGRILGFSRTASVSTRTLFLSSGNNVGPIRDMTRRCLTISIAPDVEMPAARNFKRPSLIEEVLSQREKYISCVLTIIRAWIVAGKPKVESKILSGFSEWSNICVQPLLWLGCPDPVENLLIAMLEDPDRERLEFFMDIWSIRFDCRPVMVRDLINRAVGEFGVNFSDEELKDILMDIAGESGSINRRRLGKWIARHVGQIVGGRKLVKTSGSRSSQAWHLESTELVKSVSSVSSVLATTKNHKHDGSF